MPHISGADCSHTLFTYSAPPFTGRDSMGTSLPARASLRQRWSWPLRNISYHEAVAVRAARYGVSDNHVGRLAGWLNGVNRDHRLSPEYVVATRAPQRPVVPEFLVLRHISPPSRWLSLGSAPTIILRPEPPLPPRAALYGLVQPFAGIGRGSPIGTGLRQLPRISFRRNTNAGVCRALRLAVAYCVCL
jgi:hypothetical protein